MGGIIRLENVVKMYDNGRRAINDVSFHINKHERVCIRGASGSGKTTLLTLIAGIEAPSAGSIVVDGKAVHEMDRDTAAAFRNRIFGILPRHHGFMNNLTMIENITLPLTVRKVAATQKNQSAIEQMKTLGIAYFARAYPPQLSIMELQLASLVRAFTGEPKIILIDEMEADLTKKEQEKINDRIDIIWKSDEVSIIRFTEREKDHLAYDKHFRLEYGKITEG